MGDSYRAEIAKKKKKSGHASQEMVREGAAGRAMVRELYFRKSSAGHYGQFAKKSAQKRLLDA